MNEEKISKLIKDIRTKNKLSQKEFAKKFGVTYQAVSKWERGINIPDISIIKAICKEYKISLDEFLDTGVKSKKKKSIIIISILVIIIFGVLLYFVFRKSNFEFKMISANCDDFQVTGSIAYNQNKTSLYISEIHYCGQEQLIEYQSINCNLYEDAGKMKIIVDKCEEKNDITLQEFVRGISFHIDNYSSICKDYNDESLYLEINAKDKNNKIVNYKIPMKISDNCGEKIVLD